MAEILAVVAVLFICAIVLSTVAVVKTARAVRRRVDRHVPQARRLVEDTTLRARRYTQIGPGSELAELRLTLRSSVESTRRVLAAAAATDRSLSEAIGLCARLAEHARVLDDELKILEREPDKSRISSRLPELRQRAERITHSAESLRWAAQDRARQFGDDDLTALTRQVDMEAGALRHWAPADEAFPPQAGPEPKPQPKTQRKAQPKPQPKTPEPPGITTSDPRQSFGYPWETSRERNPRPGPSSS